MEDPESHLTNADLHVIEMEINKQFPTGGRLLYWRFRRITLMVMYRKDRTRTG